MKKSVIGFIVGAVAVALIAVGLGIYKFNNTDEDIQIACTQEAKICPDGSAVSRTGPNCEFPVCPEASNNPKGGFLSESEVRLIAEKNCIKGGESLSPGYYNENSKTWWFDANLNAEKPGCHPACVVSEETKTVEINWRCTGLISPDVK